MQREQLCEMAGCANYLFKWLRRQIPSNFREFM